jgi:glycosyltransferase involved in cell wall biosynthesis
MASLRRHQPDWDRFVVLVGGDAPVDRDDEPFATIPLDALNLPAPRRFCFRYTILELNTAVKPWMFAHLFARGYDRVLYLDPDIVVYSPLREIESAAPETLLMLTPHLTGSIGGNDHPSERALLQSGTYNLGFLAVSRTPDLDRFLAWWQEKLEFQCVIDLERGLFVDQKWMDLTPGLFPGVTILRHDGYNVAYWNLRQRTVTRAGETFTVNGQPLRFFHFSGLDTIFPEMVSIHDGRLTLAAIGEAHLLIDAYRVTVRDAGERTFAQAPYAFGIFTDGARVPDAARVAYRQSDDLQQACGDDPFAHADLFRGLRDEPVRPALAAKIAVRSYQTFSRARPLVGLVPKPLRTAMRQYLLGRKEYVPLPPRWSTTLPEGINVVGYHARETGVGESARLCGRACDREGLSRHLIDVEDADTLAQQAVYRTSVFHVNADQVASVHTQMPDLFGASARNVGCWHWELAELPDAWVASAQPLDEIWAPSTFIQSAVGRKVTIPVVHMPHGIEVTDIAACSPEEFGVPPRTFTFLCMFDLDSVMQRKNPFGAIEAFRRAFPRPSSQALLIKTTGIESHRREHAELLQGVRGLPNVYLTDGVLPRARVNGLLAACDAIVSLHRAEGFGLVLAEAMALGKPVIATGWSGNMDFMHSGNSCPVDYELVTLDRTYLHYHAGEQWAEPDIDHAAHLMTRVVADDAYRARLSERARDTIRTRFSPEAAGRRYRQRLAFLG